jgi:hypothetical protein
MVYFEENLLVVRQALLFCLQVGAPCSKNSWREQALCFDATLCHHSITISFDVLPAHIPIRSVFCKAMHEESAYSRQGRDLDSFQATTSLPMRFHDVAEFQESASAWTLSTSTFLLVLDLSRRQPAVSSLPSHP